MNIIEASNNLTTKDLYFLTMNPKTQKMQEVKGQTIEIARWCIYQDVNKKTGELMEILAVATPENESFATNSPTFIDDFRKMWNLFANAGETVNAIEVSFGTSKAGREFITCLYAG